ncbi:MAG: ATP-dependent Clp protease adaptor ClpS [Bacteroidetes bacterium]|nr:ATP-dependent Clp protease adaptor ClpS [Bacteroidota bacterium]
METELLEQTRAHSEQKVQPVRELVLYNDDVNTFDFVIETLVQVCQHQTLQAEQCAYIVHYKGKCEVKKGSLSELKPLCRALLDKGLSASIK